MLVLSIVHIGLGLHVGVYDPISMTHARDRKGWMNAEKYEKLKENLISQV